MGMDLITLEVLRNKFDVSADEMEIALLKSAYSSIVKEGMDASSALFTIGGETIAQAASIPIHLGSLVPAAQEGTSMATQPSALTPMDLGRYYMRRMAMRVDADHFQELCRTVAYAIDPAHTAYSFAVHYGVTDLPTPEEVWRVGMLPD